VNPLDTVSPGETGTACDRLLTVEECDSTQDLALELAQKGAPDGYAVLGLNQTSGRGRQGREWLSPRGRNVALSVIMRPLLPAHEAPLLGMMTSIAVTETLEGAGVSARVRWPNDVLVQERKIAGILPEARIAGSNIEVAIIGIGLNVNSTPDDFPEDLRDQVTSMLISTGRQWPIGETARLLLHKLDLLYGRAKIEGCGFVPGLWARMWAHKGYTVSRDGLTGIAEGIDQDGALLIRTASGLL